MLRNRLSRARLVLTASLVTATAGILLHARGSSDAPSPRRAATTDGRVALNNLSAQIDGLAAMTERNPRRVGAAVKLVTFYLERGRFTGTVADYERAEQLAQALTEAHPDRGDAWHARAKVHALFHRFDAAQASLQRARQLGHSGQACDALLVSILAARGREVAARTTLASLANGSGTELLRARVWIDAAFGDPATAALELRALRASEPGPSPFPAAALAFQEGRLWMDAENPREARIAFRTAVDLLPDFAPALGHLAEVQAQLGDTGAAIRTLRRLAATSDDPDYAAQLARILREHGAEAEAEPWVASASARYDQLMQKHPLAFADHAAEFWLAAGNDPVRALDAARRNVANRDTARARELLRAAEDANAEAAPRLPTA